MKKKKTSRTSSNFSTDQRQEEFIVKKLPLHSLEANTYQPREHWDEEALDALAGSLKKSGVLQPILVRPLGDERYQIIAGERRWRAATQAGLSHITAVIQSCTERESLEKALLENLQRENLKALEEATAYQLLKEEFLLSPNDIAEVIGKSRSYVVNTIRLLSLPQEIKNWLNEGLLSPGGARALLKAESPLDIAKKAIKWKMTVRQIENMVKAEKHRLPFLNRLLISKTEQAFITSIAQSLKTSVRITLQGRNRYLVITLNQQDILQQLKTLLEKNAKKKMP